MERPDPAALSNPGQAAKRKMEATRTTPVKVEEKVREFLDTQAKENTDSEYEDSELDSYESSGASVIESDLSISAYRRLTFQVRL